MIPQEVFDKLNQLDRIELRQNYIVNSLSLLDSAVPAYIFYGLCINYFVKYLILDLTSLYLASILFLAIGFMFALRGYFRFKKDTHKSEDKFFDFEIKPNNKRK